MRILWVITSLVGGLSVAHGAQDAVMHDIRMTLDPERGGFQASDRIAMPSGTALRFALTDSVSLDGVSVDGREVTPARHDGRWSVVTEPGHPSTVLIRYSRSAALTTAHGEPTREAGTVFLPAGGGWVPSVSGVAQHYRLQLEVPESYRALATGRLTDETLADGRYRASFVIDYPSEPPSIFAGRYRIDERLEGATRLRTYFPEELGGLADAYLQATAAYLSRYGATIGPYAYADFSVVASPYPVGLSFPGLTYVSSRILPLPYMRTRSLAHEILHSWWGNGVYVDYDQGNWSEGLTTYLADYAIVSEDPDQAREMRLFWLRDYAALPRTRDAAVRTFTAKSHDAAQVIGYNKVAFFFHMLRRELGSDTFEGALREFWQAFRFKAASWDDLRGVFERRADRPLAGFFAQWLDRPGAPQLTLRSARSTASGTGYRVELELAQQAPTYVLTVPVRLDTDDGPAWHAIELSAESTKRVLNMDSRPTAVAVDPDYDVFRRLDVGETPPILRDVTLSDETTCILAGDSEQAIQMARSLASRLLDVAGVCDTAMRGDAARTPLLIVGTRAEVARLLASRALDPAPDDLAEEGTAVVWTRRMPSGHVMMVVAGDDAEALAPLGGPLPHYGRKSYLVFEHGRALRTGVWSVEESPLVRRF